MIMESRCKSAEDLKTTEAAYLRKVAVMKREFGAKSGHAGQALLELHDFYEKQGQTDAAGAVWDEIKNIMFLAWLRITMNDDLDQDCADAS